MLWLTAPDVPVTVSVSLPSEAPDGSVIVRAIGLPFGFIGKEPPVQLPVGTVQTTFTIKLGRLRDCPVRPTVIVVPGIAHALPEAGGCRMKSPTAREKGTEVETGPLVTSTVNG